MEYEVRRIDISLKNDVEKYVFCRYKEGYIPSDGMSDETRNRLENEGLDEDEKLIEVVKKNADMKLRKEICDKIMSGEIPLRYYVGDWDCVDMTEEKFKSLKQPLYII